MTSKRYRVLHECIRYGGTAASHLSLEFMYPYCPCQGAALNVVAHGQFDSNQCTALIMKVTFSYSWKLMPAIYFQIWAVQVNISAHQLPEESIYLGNFASWIFEAVCDISHEVKWSEWRIKWSWCDLVIVCHYLSDSPITTKKTFAMALILSKVLNCLLCLTGLLFNSWSTEPIWWGMGRN
jgi:hypothetical protein